MTSREAVIHRALGLRNESEALKRQRELIAELREKAALMKVMQGQYAQISEELLVIEEKWNFPPKNVFEEPVSEDDEDTLRRQRIRMHKWRVIQRYRNRRRREKEKRKSKMAKATKSSSGNTQTKTESKE